MLGELLSEFSKVGSLNLSSQIERLASLLGQCDQFFVDKSLNVNLHEVIDKTQNLSVMAREPSTTSVDCGKAIEQTFNHISKQFHSVLMRFGDRAESELIYDLFYDMLRQQTIVNNLLLTKDVVFTNLALGLTWPKDTSGYLPICGYISQLFGEIFSNIAGKSILTLPPNNEQEFSNMEDKAKAWLRFDLTEEIKQGITIIIVTGLDLNKTRPPKYKPAIPGLFDFGIKVESKIIKQSEIASYFEVSVRIPSLANILEEL